MKEEWKIMEELKYQKNLLVTTVEKTLHVPHISKAGNVVIKIRLLEWILGIEETIARTKNEGVK